MQKKPGIATFGGFNTTKVADRPSRQVTPAPQMPSRAARTPRRMESLSGPAREPQHPLIEEDAVEVAMLQARLEAATEAMKHIARERANDELQEQQEITRLREDLTKVQAANVELEKDLQHAREIIKYSNASMPNQLQLAFRTAIVAFVGAAFATIAYTIFSL